MLAQGALSLPARMVLAEILNLHKKNQRVWANDQHFSNRLPGVALRTVGGAIKELVDAGFIVRVTKQNADPKRTLTPTALCYLPLADSARGTEEEEPDEEAYAESARATPDHMQNPQEPPAKSATDLLQELQEPPAESADIKYQLNNQSNTLPPSEGKSKKGKGNSSSPEVKNPEGEQSSLGAAEPWAVWINENTPQVQKLKSPMTAKQWAGLVADYGEPTVQLVLLAMENRASLLKDYTSANLTCREWCSRRGPKLQKAAPKPAPSAEPEVDEAEVSRAEAQRAAEASDYRRRLLRDKQSDAAA
ncbi:MAG: hypothetical protein ACRYG7_07850 [Janthinobacterium lividum]